MLCQRLSWVPANSTSIFGVIGIAAYSKRHAISNLHMSVKSGRSTEVAKSISQRASEASIIMFAALRSPWASPTSGASSFPPWPAKLINFSLMESMPKSFIDGSSARKYSLYSLRIAGSAGYSPFAAVYRLKGPGLPFRVYQPQSSGVPSERWRPRSPFLSDETTPPGPNVSAMTLFTLPNGRFSAAAGLELTPRSACSLS
mmetsp:Transcript_90621/g.256173  ORF Transcript_90621/g.256173 Transcript_90621/m.256173 type:complete len:201 (-) Transcript_90621:977-1579(-)